MKQLQFYKYATWTLVIINLTLLVFFFLLRPKPPHPFSHRAIDILQLDKTQHASFQQFVEKHKKQMKNINDQQQALLKTYFNSLVQVNATTDAPEILFKFQQLETEKITQTYQHFKEIKSLLREDQMAGFERFMNSALNRVLGSGKKLPPPPKDF